MKLLGTPILAACVFAALAAQPAQAKRAYHHHASFYANHPHYHQRSHHRSFVHHAAHYAVHYAVHYEIRRAVRAALAPVDGRAHPAAHPHQVAAISTPGHAQQASAPVAPQPDSLASSPGRIEYAHTGPRIGIDLAPGETRVAAVTPGSPAYAAGVDPDDIITRANGAAIRSAEDFAKAINDATPSGALKLTIERGGRPFNATIALDQRDVR